MRFIPWPWEDPSDGTLSKVTQDHIASQDDQSGITMKEVDANNEVAHEAATSPAVCVWVIAFVLPLMNDVIEALRAANQSHLMNTHAILAMTIDAMHICTEAKCKEFKKVPVGIPFFKRSEPPQADRLSDTKLNLSLPTRAHSREEPLQFPEMIPLEKQSHFQGRWMQLSGETSPEWVSYPPTGPSNPFVLLTNASLGILIGQTANCPMETSFAP